MFIETRERRPNGLIRGWVNSTEIVRILDEGPDGVVAELRDGKTVQLDRHQHIPQAGHQVLPAQPGFELLTALLGGMG